MEMMVMVFVGVLISLSLLSYDLEYERELLDKKTQKVNH